MSKCLLIPALFSVLMSVTTKAQSIYVELDSDRYLIICDSIAYEMKRHEGMNRSEHTYINDFDLLHSVVTNDVKCEFLKLDTFVLSKSFDRNEIHFEIQNSSAELLYDSFMILDYFTMYTYDVELLMGKDSSKPSLNLQLKTTEQTKEFAGHLNTITDVYLLEELKGDRSYLLCRYPVFVGNKDGTVGYDFLYFKCFRL